MISSAIIFYFYFIINFSYITFSSLLGDRLYKNSSGDEKANVNFYAVRPQATRIRWNNAK